MVADKRSTLNSSFTSRISASLSVSPFLRLPPGIYQASLPYDRVERIFLSLIHIQASLSMTLVVIY